MKVISLVPSLTETFIECGMNVVGRTRYCIHPSDKVKHIPVLGGTKGVDWSKAPEADIVIFEKEENKKEMAESCPYPFYALHVESLDSLKRELEQLSALLKSQKLMDLSKSLASCLKKKVMDKKLSSLPAVIRKNSSWSSVKDFQYLIWKKPYMAIGKNTFIADMFYQLGYARYLVLMDEKYPKLEKLSDEVGRGFLLSSEPYPFAREWEDWENENLPAALIDGEMYSWYGIRSINFLIKNK